MPLIQMYFGKGTLTEEKKVGLARKVTDLVVKETGQPQHYTWIVIHEEPSEHWMIDRLTLSELKAKIREEGG